MRTTRRPLLSLLALATPVAAAAVDSSEPRGDLIELHSCQLYTGGCTASSEATMEGRSLVRFWNIESGSVSGIDLAGTQVAVIQVAGANLAFQDTVPSTSLVYIASDVSDAAIEPLLGWLNQQDTLLSESRVEVKRGTIDYRRDGDTALLRVADSVELKAVDLASCETGACGQQLWYTPRSRTSAFKVIAHQTARVDESALNLRWSDHGKPNVFLARFGEPATLARVKLEGTEICGL